MRKLLIIAGLMFFCAPAMAVMEVRDGANTQKYLAADGIGTVAAPYATHRVDVAPEDSGYISFQSSDMTTSETFILIDKSDTINYPHSEIGHLKLHNLYLDVDADSSADYELRFGFLENVDASNGDFHEVFTISGSNTTGQNKQFLYNPYPSGPAFTSAEFLSSNIDLNDTTFQTDVNLLSITDTTAADTGAGTGDFVMQSTITGGTITVQAKFSYHGVK